MTLCTPPIVGIRRPLKASFIGAGSYHPELTSAIAQLTISVGENRHEGERLKATVALINRSFAACKIMLDDSIQWYTLAIAEKALSKACLLHQAIQAGDDYLNRNESLFKSHLTIPYEIIRWKDWIDTSEWQAAITEMKQFYEIDASVRAAIHQNVVTFLSRYEQRNVLQGYDRHHAWHLCVDYLLEECAVMRTFWVKLGCHFEVYPSSRNEAMTATYERYIQPYYPHLLRSIGLRFHRRGS